MRKVDIAGRFERALSLVRLEVQANLTRFFEEDRLAMQLYLDAAGIRFDDSLITDYDRSLWKQHGGQLFFLPIVSESKLDGMFEPPTTPRSGPSVYLSRGKNVDWHGHLASAAASLFGMWVFFHDRARGSYYFPFPAKNYQFCTVDRDGEAHSVLPARRYLQAIEPLLRGFSLELGEGSLGLARRLDRDVIVEDTLTDPRGSVALEDLLLRNFSFSGFAISSTSRLAERSEVEAKYSAANMERVTLSDAAGDDVIAQSRFGGKPFSVLGLIFPAPMRGERESNACLRLFEHVKVRSMSRLADTLEPLACHIDDAVLREALRRVASEMSEKAADAQVDREAVAEELRRRFAAAVAGRGDPFDEALTNNAAPRSMPADNGGVSNLRDAFAIGSVHILENVKKGQFDVRAYWHGQNSFGRSVRERIESTQVPTNSDPARFVGDICSELRSSLAKVTRQDLILNPISSSWNISEFGDVLTCGVWLRSSQDVTEVATSDKLGTTVAETIIAKRGRSAQAVKPDELLREADRWARRAYQSPAAREDADLRGLEVAGFGQSKFGEAIRRHKTVEAMLNLTSSFVEHEETVREATNNSASHASLLNLLSDFTGKHHSEAWSSLWPDTSEVRAPESTDATMVAPILSFSAYRPRLGLDSGIACFCDGKQLEATEIIAKELFQPNTYRTLLLAALYADRLIDPARKETWCSIRVSDVSSKLSGVSPLRSGVYSESGGWNISGFGTPFADSYFWEQVLGIPVRSPAEWLLCRNHSGPDAASSIEIVLAAEEARDELVRGAFPPKHGLAVRTLWTADASRWSFCNWTVATHLLPRRAASGDLPPIPFGQRPALLELLESCRDANVAREMVDRESFTFCYPKLSPNVEGSAVHLEPSALRKQTCKCPCDRVAASLGSNRAPGEVESVVSAAGWELRAALNSDDALSTLGAGAVSTAWPLSYEGGPLAVPGAVILTMSRTEPAVSRDLSGPTQATADGSAVPRRPSSGAAVSSLASALISQAIDYLRFVLAQDASHRRRTTELSGFAHSLKHAFQAQTTLQEVFASARKLVLKVSGERSEEPSAKILKLVTNHVAPYTMEEEELARCVTRAFAAFRAPDVGGVIGDQGETITVSLFQRHRAFDLNYYLGHSLIRALTRTLADKPEERPDRHKPPLEPRFADAAGWIGHLFERKWVDLQEYPALREAIAEGWSFSPNRCVHPKLVDCVIFPGSSLEIVVDEMLKNLRDHADFSRPISFRLRCGGRRTELEIESASYSRLDDRANTSKGIPLMRRIVEANMGERRKDIVVAGMDGDQWRTVVRLDLDRYKLVEEREHSKGRDRPSGDSS